MSLHAQIAEAKRRAIGYGVYGQDSGNESWREGTVRCTIVEINYDADRPEVYCNDETIPTGYIGGGRTSLAWFEAEPETEYHIEFWAKKLVVISVASTYPPSQKYFIEVYYEVPPGKSLEEAVITAMKVIKVSE